MRSHSELVEESFRLINRYFDSNQHDTTLMFCTLEATSLNNYTSVFEYQSIELMFVTSLKTLQMNMSYCSLTNSFSIISAVAGFVARGT